VYNQADHITTILTEYVQALTPLNIDFELIPVINGPRKDKSFEVCKHLESQFPSIRTLCIDGSGWGRAVRAGLAEARGDLLCYTNSARTSGKDLQLFLLYASLHTDLVIKANRKIRDNWRRRLGSLLYNLECRALFDLPYWDINGTPKVFPRTFQRLLALHSNDDLIDLEFNVVCRRESYPMIELPMFSTRRHSGSSTTGLSSAIRMYSGAFSLKRKMNSHG
jgi:hypothetical protein